MECKIYRNQYIRKSEALNNYRKDVNRQNALQVDQHLKLPNHNFSQHARFTLIEQLGNVNIEKDLAILHLKKREDFWIKN